MPKFTHSLCAVAFCVALQSGTAANAFSINTSSWFTNIPTYQIWTPPTFSFPTFSFPTYNFNPPTYQIAPITPVVTPVQQPMTQVQNAVSSVPVPAALPLMALAMGVLGFAARRRRDV